MSRRDAKQEQAMASISLLVSKQHSRLSDFVTLTKPGVMMLAVFTAIVGLTIAPGDLAPLRACLAVLAIAAGAGAAGVLNMWYDADIDAVMTRTARRPIPSGRIGQGEALAFGLVLAAGSVVVLALAANLLAAGLLAFTILFYVVVYTAWLKRRTPHNIVIGGAAGALPPAGVLVYTIGLLLAVILTATSFWVVNTSLLWGPGVHLGLAVLAIAQMGVHLVFFLHISAGPDSSNNVLAVAFGVLIVFLVVAGSLWIMADLNDSMMPATEMMKMHMHH
jgi:cytochrome o ubiquinol oxidase subunit IV